MPAVVRGGREKPLALTEAALEAAWRGLGSEDAAEGAVSLQTLTRAAPQAVRLIRARVEPVSKERMERLLRDLDSRRFARATGPRGSWRAWDALPSRPCASCYGGSRHWRCGRERKSC